MVSDTTKSQIVKKGGYCKEGGVLLGIGLIVVVVVRVVVVVITESIVHERGASTSQGSNLGSLFTCLPVLYM